MAIVGIPPNSGLRLSRTNRHRILGLVHRAIFLIVGSGYLHPLVRFAAWTRARRRCNRRLRSRRRFYPCGLVTTGLGLLVLVLFLRLVLCLLLLRGGFAAFGVRFAGEPAS